MTDAPIKKSEIARSFSTACHTYDQHAFIQKEIGQRLLERLNLIKIQPKIILDVGSGTGFLTRQLQNIFSKSRIIGIDLALGMNTYARSKQGKQWWKNKPSYVCGDTETLPFKKESVDLIFSNFTLQWCFNLDKAFAEFKRVLKPDGMLFFSTLGPQTLYELRQSFTKIDTARHVNEFTDMHDIGDLLLNSQFNDPIMDMEMITATYTSVKELLMDLKLTGAHNLNNERNHGLTSKGNYYKLLEAYEKFKQPDNLYPATFEIVYGHAFKALQHSYRADKEGVVKIPASKIPLLDSIL